jgi:hypothetical protein
MRSNHERSDSTSWSGGRLQQGLGAVAVIVALLIAAILYFGYFGMQSAMTEQKRTVTAIDTSKAFACKTNRQTVEREVQMWLVNHPGETPSLAALHSDGGGTATCPEGGTYRMEGVRVLCSTHD